ncbi:hypothetical protein G7B40_034275 [Aetokthonos hydrillicola Thurmond2011]|jgi:hypothetical protein|uniref:Surface-adhesin protein E-like domain-containing protein n=1 Tax=Aetokthonos hydrillicola Thurmond2011 TaxID=2712845 RepID=A0AAP5IDG3_9CYAN|nr:surface-adhesin E family protein [Aetokthonos hydrillicola]MBO3462713.1 hypothetical protein [Aetokthonos hydrillicola CCALA 1050]MBW4585252.1 hypothetical protein [Aetokthonos hydrillicola CCALA 1050]MDR9899588.1 hypothetical protein [Aetokthonos hydrillicola Thurmond2011]
MLKHLVIASLITLTSVSSVYAEVLVPIGELDNGTSLYLDTDSIQGKDGYYQYSISFGNHRVSQSERWLIACKERTTRLLARRKYATNGRIISSNNYPNDQPLRPVVAGSMASVAAEAVCR